MIQTKSLILAVILVTHSAGCAQNVQKNKIEKTITKSNVTMMEKTDNEQKDIIKVVNKLSELMIARDLEGLDKILDKNYTLTHMTGYLQPKAEWFDEVEKESMKYYSVKEVSKAVKINGNKAEVIDQNMVDARIWGSRNTWRLQQILQLEKRDGQWIILESVASTF